MQFDAKVSAITARTGGTFEDRSAILHDVTLEARIPPMSRSARASITLTGLSSDEALSLGAGSCVTVVIVPAE